jgi:long-chain acyl-CoA synthetase
MDAAGVSKRKLFYSALRAKTAGLQQGHLKHTLYDKLLFNKIKAALGMDHIRFMVSGSAPLASNVMTFFRCLLGVPVIEGYGQTEGTAAAPVSHTEDVTSVGHVGGPVQSCEIILMDVPEMAYLSTDRSHGGEACFGRGEICIRGPNVFCGYYKEEEKTREAVDVEGWLHSGDIGLWLPSGCLKIIDRKKNIFKLAQGEYVAAEKIENILIRSLLIGQCFVYGDSFQSCLVAIIVPDEDVLRKWANDVDAASLGGESIQELCQNEQLIGEIMMQIKSLSKSSGLHGFEMVRAVHLEAEPFSVENGLLTPTFKIKRQQLKERFQNHFDRLYATLLKAPSKL